MEKNEFAKQVLEAEATMYHISKSILRNDCDCADAVQEAIITAFSKLNTLRDDRLFKTWLCRILINECYQICRNNKRVVSLEDYMEDEKSATFQNNSELYGAIMKLNTELRMVIVLHYIEGFRTAEIAVILKIPEGTVKSRLSRARSELKTILGEQEEFCHEK